MIEVLAPRGDTSAVERLLAAPPRQYEEPFSPRRRTALSRISQAIFAEPNLRGDAAAAALAFWLRASHLDQIQARFRDVYAAKPHVVPTPLGLVFHIAPANVDTMFLYSWALSFLCGNSNLVRLSTRRSVLLERLLDCWTWAIQIDPLLRDANALVTYPHDDETTARISAAVQMRVIWGGDQTVARIRQVPLNPHARQRTFSSKLSLTVIDSHAYHATADQQRQQLADAFAADILPFSQWACSSPHLVVWFGPGNCTQLRNLFQRHLIAALQKRGAAADVSAVVDRRGRAFDLFAQNRATLVEDAPELLTLSATATAPLADYQCGGSTVTHAATAKLADLASLIDDSVQTVTYFGLDPEQRRRFACELGARGADRLVPVGQALSFDSAWDGHDLIGDFLNEVYVE